MNVFRNLASCAVAIAALTACGGAYSMEQDCTLRATGDVLPQPEDCTTTSAGNLHFIVRSGEVNPDGASYLMLVHAAP